MDGRYHKIIIALVSVCVTATMWATLGNRQAFAVDAGNPDSAGPKVDTPFGNGKTALMLAARNRQLDRVTTLLDAGADATRANDNGGTPLMYAALGGDPRIVRLLLDHDVDLNAKAENGWSAVMIAAAKGYVEVVRMLMDEGADPTLVDVYGWTPLMRAGFENRTSVVKLLLQHDRVDINRRGENGLTALHLAATQGHVEIVRLLVEHGADPNIKDNFDRTAYAIALESKQSDLLNVLSK
jgi:ankyrin repeat protein